MDCEYLTVYEIARELRVDPESVRRWLRAGKLAGVNLGRAGWRVRRDDYEQFVTDRYTGDKKHWHVQRSHIDLTYAAVSLGGANPPDGPPLRSRNHVAPNV
jgi:excisionase family DNA binding protein